MPTTSLTLSGDRDAFIEREIDSGRDSSASEVVRATLRESEDKGKRPEALRHHLAEGSAQAAKRDFAEDSDIEDATARAKTRA